MAIQPIDLQTLYSQLENVSKTVAHQQQGVHLNNAIQQDVKARQLAEEKTAVQKLQTDKDSIEALKDKKQSFGQKNQSSRQQQEEESSEQEEPTQIAFKDPNLGKYIDISG